MSGRVIPIIWEEKLEISRSWATAHFLVFYD